MNIREHSSQFSVLIFSTDVDQGAAIKVALSRAGYDVYYVDSEAAFFDRVEQMLPHLIVLSLKSLQTKLNEVIEKISMISSEMKIIFLTEDKNFQVLTDYVEYGVLDIVIETDLQIENRVLWSVDRSCERLYLTYQNEQIHKELIELQSIETPSISGTGISNPSITNTNVTNPSITSTFARDIFVSEEESFSCKEFISDLRSAQSKEEMVGVVLRSAPTGSLSYLRYLPSMSSFLVADTNYPTADKLKGLGCRLQPEESKELGRQLELGIVPPSLSELLSKALQVTKPRLKALMNGGTLEGLIVGSADQESRVKILNDKYAIIGLAYSLFCLEKRIETLEVLDSATELFNQKFYTHKLEEELQRAKRFLQPLSLIKVGIDDLSEIEKTLGLPTRDLIFKNLAGVIQKSSRSHDVACRTDANEISIILPQCHKGEAEVRAERLRRIIETNSLVSNGLKMSISLGAAEFPGTASSAEKLDEGAKRALQFIMSRGGNKLCFFKAPADHRPEFIPKPVVGDKQ